MSSKPRIYLGRLSHRAREYDVEDFLKGYGKIRDIMLKNGFGFVEFEDFRDADDAVHDLNGKMLCGERVVLEMAKGTPRGAGGQFLSGYNPPSYSSSRRGGDDRRESRSSGGRAGYGRPQNGYRLIVSNLSSRYNWQDMKDMFDRCGEIFYINAHHYRKNEGVVEFARKKDMEYCIQKYEGKELNGRKIKLTAEASKYSASRSRSRSGSRSRSRSSSRGRGKKASKRSRSRSGSRSRDRKRHRSRSESEKSRRSEKSKSPKGRSKTKSRSKSVESNRSRSSEGAENGHKNGVKDQESDSEEKKSKSRSKSRSKSKSRSRSPTKSRSPSRSRSRSTSSKSE